MVRHDIVVYEYGSTKERETIKLGFTTPISEDKSSRIRSTASKRPTQRALPGPFRMKESYRKDEISNNWERWNSKVLLFSPQTGAIEDMWLIQAYYQTLAMLKEEKFFKVDDLVIMVSNFLFG